MYLVVNKIKKNEGTKGHNKLNNFELRMSKLITHFYIS